MKCWYDNEFARHYWKPGKEDWDNLSQSSKFLVTAIADAIAVTKAAESRLKEVLSYPAWVGYDKRSAVEQAAAKANEVLAVIGVNGVASVHPWVNGERVALLIWCNHRMNLIRFIENDLGVEPRFTCFLGGDIALPSALGATASSTSADREVSEFVHWFPSL